MAHVQRAAAQEAGARARAVAGIFTVPTHTLTILGSTAGVMAVGRTTTTITLTTLLTTLATEAAMVAVTQAHAMEDATLTLAMDVAQMAAAQTACPRTASQVPSSSTDRRSR